MVNRLTKVRLRRHLLRSKYRVEDISSQAGEGIDRNFVERLSRLFWVRRFVLVWLGLLVLVTGIVVVQTGALSNYYQTRRPLPGGVYTEGILGDFDNANPIYASGSVDNAVSSLIFAGLLSYNNQNQLVGDLASSWNSNSLGNVWTVTLKPNLTWQDGQPLTAADVVFTYQTIQNPDSLSPLNQEWQSVVVKEINPLTVSFTLSNPLASFPYSLTTGIIPEHILENIPPADLRTAGFNTGPIGAGPFEWKDLTVAGGTPATRQEQIALIPFSHFNGGAPKLNQFVIRAFHDSSFLVSSFQAGDINSLAGLDSVPAQLKGDKDLNVYNIPLTAANMVFFRTDDGVLSSAVVRGALVQGINVDKLINGLGYPAIPVREPLLDNQLGYNPAYTQLPYNPTAADSALLSAGWILGQNGFRYKGSQQLTFNLYALDNSDDIYATNSLSSQWKAIGVNAQVILQDNSDFENTVAFHEYDALLYGISIGVDPDVFVYWDSSEADINSPFHSNYSEYSSSTADASLEAGRTRLDPQLRAVKYEPFLSVWQQDAPALGLYQPRFLYITNEPVYGLTSGSINSASDRFDNVQNWEVLGNKVTD